jgi:hypothetical protein
MMFWESAKAIIESCTSLLFLEGKFHPSYGGRMQILADSYKDSFPSLYARYPELPEEVERATRFKLKPSIGIQEEPLKYWFKSRDIVCAAIEEYICKAFAICGNHAEQSLGIRKRLGGQYFSDYMRMYIERRKKSTAIPWSLMSRLESLSRVVEIAFQPSSPSGSPSDQLSYFPPL